MSLPPVFARFRPAATIVATSPSPSPILDHAQPRRTKKQRALMPLRSAGVASVGERNQIRVSRVSLPTGNTGGLKYA